MGKKNLDKLFQEKFNDFSQIPDKKVWENISASLDKKKRNRSVIPIWWKLGGVAALLAVLMYVMAPFNNTPNKIPAVITDIKKSDNNNSSILGEDEDKNSETHQSPEQIEEGIVNSEIETLEKGEEAVKDKNEGVVIKSSKEQPALITKGAPQKQETQVVANNLEKSPKEKNNIGQELIKTSTLRNKDNAVVKNNIMLNNPSEEVNEKYNQDAIKTLQDNIKNTDQEAIAKSDIEEKVEDSKGKSIFDEIDEQEALQTDEKKGGRWTLGANVAPVFFNSLGEGSPIHSDFVSNSKSGDVNMSYGLSVAYNVGKKLSIRSGIHKVDYGYGTNDIEFSSSLAFSTSGQIDNISYFNKAENTVVDSKSAGNTLRTSDAFDVSGQSNSRNGVMIQQFGYLEIPLELNYALVDKRFGINLVGGVSSLFLTDNSVALSSGDLTTEIGKANNLNDINFSTNIGFGLNYKFSPKIQLNIEPVFKYQLNTFSNTSGNFQPFSVGVYSGLNFRF